jgi:hypothetical protein
MSLEQTIGNLEIRYANVVTFVGSSNTMVDTTTGRIQTKGIQHNSNVITDVSGPHGRVAPTLKKYPEIAFESGKFDSNDSTNTYVQAGYTVSASRSQTAIVGENLIWEAFNGIASEIGMLLTGNNYDNDGNANTTGTTASRLSASDSTPHGEWLKLKLPNKIKLNKYVFTSRNDTTNWTQSAEAGQVWGSDNDSDWVHLHTFTSSGFTGASQTASFNVTTNNYYKYYAFIVTKTFAAGTNGYLCIPELEYYGYEEDPPAGDHSVDTTFKSRFNNPQLTGVQVLVDGATGVGTNHISGGPDPSGNQATMTSPNKYWTLNGTLTSNLSVEANTFLEGDQPHAVSVWFNSSNLEANVSNTCVFSVSDQEKLNSQNLDLQSNTWHNLTYAYQGEGGSKVTYLDGRKVAEDQAEDTFGEYPPFEMTGYSQGGYVVSVSSEYLSDVNALRNAYKVYNPTTDTAGVWMTEFSTFNPNAVGGDTFTDSDGGTHTGHWNKIELPYKLKPSYFYFKNSGTLTGSRNATNWVILGSNNDSEWDLLHSSTTVLNATKSIPITATKGYTYLMFLCKSVNADTALYMEEIRYYGHRENDLVRLPDPTNVLKYPHIAMTGPAQRGYVASASSTYTSEYQAFKMFADDGATNPSPYGGKGWWKSATGKYNTSDPFNYLGGTTDNLGTYTGSSTTTDNGVWIQLKMPHKILLSSVFLGMSAWHETAPGSFKIYGTNNDTDWTLIKAFTGQNPQSGTSFAINATVAYRTIGLVITHVAGGADGSSGISEIDFYGTGVDSIPIQIGGGNIDKVANFRVYDKFIGEDQVNEIWNAQKEEFGRAKPQMVLQQGKLGIGTDAPQGSLSVADEPDPTTYGLQEFPPRGVTGEETYMEEHGVFTASVSSVYNSGYEGWRAFDKNTTSALIGRWTALNSSSTIGSLSGKWVKLELPYRVNFSKVGIFPPAYSGGSAQCPTGFSIIVSNDDETWTTIKTLSSYTWKEFDYNYITFENDGYFKYIAIVATTDGSNGATSFQEILYLGYREQVTKQSVLHDGQLTLTKNLTVPRIGPEIGEYPTPRQDKIHLQYDTSLSIHADNHIMDTSGRSRDLSRSGNGYYNSGTESLHFDGNDSYYNTGIGDWSDNQHHTHSFWVKTTANSGNPVVLWNAVNNNHDYSGVSINAGSHFSFWHFGNDHNYNYNVQKNVWYHVAAVYNGNSKTQKMYINGEEIPVTGLGTISSLSMGTNPKISLGGDYGRSNYYFTGEISKYRLHSVDLTPEEVFTLYKQGRTTPVHHLQVVDSTMTIGSHNRHRDAQLDVAGHIRAGSGTIHTFTGQHRCFPDEPMEKGLIVSAKKNQFVKLNGLATGKSAITIDESLPIVSLSNMHQDKACFGVVSSIEKSTPRRSQIVNGIISDIKKEKGDNRAIVNSVGEGGIWVVDTNGPLESGDYITTSNVAGYGQKQDDDILHNFTVAKITMDCDFTASNVAVQTIKREETGTRIITEDAWNQLVEYDRYSNVEDEITTYYQIQRGGNVLDDNGQLQFEDKTGATEEPYERRFLTADGSQTDEANTVHTAAFVGCTYHCG